MKINQKMRNLQENDAQHRFLPSSSSADRSAARAEVAASHRQLGAVRDRAAGLFNQSSVK